MPKEPDVGSETRLMRRCRAVGMTRQEAVEKRLHALEVWCVINNLGSLDMQILADHVQMAATIVWPDESTSDFRRKLC